MIGGLQREFGDLDIKYLKQNISKSRSEISGSFNRTPRHCAKNGCESLRVSAIRGSGHVWPGKLKRLLSHPTSGAGCEISDQRIRTCLTRQNSGSEISARRKGDRLRVQGAPQSPDDTEHTLLSGALHPDSPKGHTPQCYPDSLMEKHTALVNITPRMIAYPIRICCSDHWLKWASIAIAHVPPSSNGVSGRPVRTSLPWIPKNSPQSRIALVIK